MEINFELNQSSQQPIKAEIKTDAQMLIVANAEVLFEL